MFNHENRPPESEAFQVKKSKRNLDRRQQEIAQRLDRRWQPRLAEPMLKSGNIRYEVSGRVKATAYGGLGMMQEVVKTVGLREAIDREVTVLKQHKPYHESDHILALVYSILTGGNRLQDLGLRRHDLAFLDAIGARKIPDPTTSGDFLQRFGTEQIEALMEAVNQARSSVWRLQPKSQRQLARIDVDGTIVETDARCKERMDMAYDGRWGFGPLIVSLANTQEVLYSVNRPASRPSHEGAPEWIDKAIDWALHGAGFDRVRLRGDTDFSLTRCFDGWNERGVEFVFGIDAHRSFVRRAKTLPEEAWAPLERPVAERAVRRRRPKKVKDELIRQKGYRTLKLSKESVAEMSYRPRKARTTYRMIVVRKQIHVTQGQLQLEDEIRYFFYVTNIPASEYSPTEVVRENNARCDQENLIEQLKNGVKATRLPVRAFNANWTFLVIGALAWNLKAWAGLLLPASLGARSLLKMEFRRFLQEIMLAPTQILRTGRRLVYRLLGVNSWTRLLLEGTVALRRW